METTFKSFCWSLGTTSFRMKNFNKKIELQLLILRDFWELPENSGEIWTGNNDLQTRYYRFMSGRGFISGDAENKPKDAREKTSGLLNLGLTDEGRRLSAAGKELLRISESNDFSVDNILNLPSDSFLYFKQLLKTSNKVDSKIVRPFVITVYFLKKLDYLSYDEFTYLLPLVTDKKTLSKMIDDIEQLRKGKTTVDEIILNRLMEKENYKKALKYFTNSENITEEIIMNVGMNRKSRGYDRWYYGLFLALRDFWAEKNGKTLRTIFDTLGGKPDAKKYWWKYLFDASRSENFSENLLKHMKKTYFEKCETEKEFRIAFFSVMHVIKAKMTLNDYFDLNRRYMKTTDVILFDDSRVTLDIIPKHYFHPIVNKLPEIAFSSCARLADNIELEEIEEILAPDESAIRSGINEEFSLNIKSLNEADEILKRQRYLRFNRLIESKFTDDKLIKLLDLMTDRKDDEIQEMVTDNADIPTIFEYLLGVMWYKISGYKGDVLCFMKLSLDADLLPKTHAAGGEADIVYEYEKCPHYPKHFLLIEATLADKENQRRMEMEPVSRHLGNHILKMKNRDSYCVFASNNLNINVVSDFRGRKHITYYDTTDFTHFIDGMKIIPLQISDLKNIIHNHMTYEKLFKIFEDAYSEEKLRPLEWRRDCIVKPICRQ